MAGVHGGTPPVSSPPVEPCERFSRTRLTDVLLSIGFLGVVTKESADAFGGVMVSGGKYLNGAGWSVLQIGTFHGGAICESTVLMGRRYNFSPRSERFAERLEASCMHAGDAIAIPTDKNVHRLIDCIGRPPLSPELLQEPAQVFVLMAVTSLGSH